MRREPDVSQEGLPRITPRALVLGVLTIAAVFSYSAYVGQGMRTGSYVKSQFPMTVWLPFVLWLFANVGLKRLWPRLALRRGEVLTIFVMVWVVGTLPQCGWMNYWLSLVAAPGYFATPENQWAEAVFPYVPWHIFPSTARWVMEGFWMGSPGGAELPWYGWAGMIGQWLGVSMAMVVFGLCVVTLFQRHWTEAEKLTFPLAQMPLEMTRGFDGPRRMPDIFRSYLFWMGFGVVFLTIFYNIITYFALGLPRMDVFFEHYNVQISQHLPRGIWFRVMPPVLALAYLCPLDILASLLVFYWLSVPKEWIIRRLGVSVGDEGQQLENWDILYMESYGALIFLSLWSIWLARKHLRRVWRQVSSGVGDRRDVAHYRLALAGLALSGAYIVAWGVSLGMSLPLAAGVFALMALVYFVTIKLIAATGFAYLFPNMPHLKGESFIVDLVGTANISPRDLVGFKLFTSHAFFSTFRIPAWPALPHHLRIFSLRDQPRWVVAAVLLAFPVGFLVVVGSYLDLCYDRGGFSVIGGGYGMVFFDSLANVERLTTLDLGKWGVWLWGFFEAAGIALLRARLHWFPLHPIGPAFQYTFGTWLYWFSLFLVCAVKVTLLRYGGVRAYLAGKPFFYGLAIGYASGIILSAVVDLIWFPSEAHHLHGW